MDKKLIIFRKFIFWKTKNTKGENEISRFMPNIEGPMVDTIKDDCILYNDVWCAVLVEGHRRKGTKTFWLNSKGKL